MLLSLGSAFVATTRSLATALIRPDQIGRLYSAAAVVQSIRILVAGPWFAQLFDASLQLDGSGAVWSRDSNSVTSEDVRTGQRAGARASCK